MFLIILGGILGAGLLTLLSSARVLREYQRAIVFRLGRARPVPAGPGLVFLAPFGIDRAVVVDTRTKVIQIPVQEVITYDNVSMMVDAVVYADIASPAAAVLTVEEYMPATLQLAATMLRSILGKMELDEILAKRAEINEQIREVLDSRTEQWGVEITAVEIKDITLPQEMKRAIARQAEAERERRAKVIMAEGELQAAEKLTQAAAMMSREPASLQLRLYQTLVEVSAERSNTIVFPVPMELLPSAGAAPQAMASLVTGAATALASQARNRPAVEATPPASAASLAATDMTALRAALEDPAADPAAAAPATRPRSRSGRGSSE